MKFLILFKKEILDLASAQIFITFGAMFVMLFFITNFTGNVVQTAAAGAGEVIAILDEDKSALTTDMLASFAQEGVRITMLTGEGEAGSYIVIPKGFETGIRNGMPQTVKSVSTLKSLSIVEAARTGNGGAVDRMNRYVSEYLAEQQSITDISLLLTPVTAQSVTIAGGKRADVDAGALVTALTGSSFFVPLVVMLLTMFAAQMISMAVTNEKTDKTLETLMSTPISKMEILFAKISSAAVIAAILAAVFTLVLSGSAVMSSGAGGADAALVALGLTLTPGSYVLLGVDILLTVATALCVAFILTVIAAEPKSTQLTTYPLVILTVIPYLLTVFTDVNALPALPRLVVMLIPFTHTFTATANILLGHMELYLLGVCYQAAFLAATVFVTVKIFSSDVIFTGVRWKRKGRGRHGLSRSA